MLDFDDIAVNPEAPIPADYGGFEWRQTGVFDVNGYGGALGYRASSGANVAFIAEARPGVDLPGYPDPAQSPLVITRVGEDFTIFHAHFCSAFGSGITITAEAYDNGVLVGTHVFDAPTGATVEVDFQDPDWGRFSGIDEFRLSASDYFGFDDLTYAVL